ncbi:MAG: TetR/AcrR family transcriptional regulator [Clostridia bacterium]|nr:TetR/AcrR family transcriptional regulator [Clostridia bacterium]
MSGKQLKVEGVNNPKTSHGMMKMNTIVEAAVELFVKEGFYQTSISDICKKAKTAVGTFYIYFDSKADIYKYLMAKYKSEIKQNLASSIAGCTTRREKEKEGIKSFIRYVVKTPNVYNIIWGSLSIDHKMFSDYYESFAKSYIRALTGEGEEVRASDYSTVAYMLMGISNFLGLKAMFENMSDDQIEDMIEHSVMPCLENGVFLK